MDELERRRQLKTDPEGFVRSLSDEELRELDKNEVTELQDQRKFEQKLEKAFNIEVPDELSEKIILRQQLTKNRSRMRYLSLAATVTLVIFAGLFMPTSSNLSLSAQALAHVDNEEKYLFVEGKVPQKILNGRIKQMGLELSALPKKITLAMRCGLGGKDAMHIIARVDDQPVSILMTNEYSNDSELFGDGKRVGKRIQNGKTNIYIIADNMELVDRLIDEIKT